MQVYFSARPNYRTEVPKSSLSELWGPSSWKHTAVASRRESELQFCPALVQMFTVVGFQRKWILLARNTRTVARNMRTVTCNTRIATRNFAQRNSDWKPYQQVNYQVKTCLFFCISSIIFQIAGIKTLFITCTASSLLNIGNEPLFSIKRVIFINNHNEFPFAFAPLFPYCSVHDSKSIFILKRNKGMVLYKLG